MNKEKLKQEKKYIKRLIIISSIIIIVSSLSAFMMAKSEDLFKTYIELNKNKTFDDYISLVLVNYFMNIAEPIIISIFTYFTYKKYGISRLYKLFFSAITALKLFNIVIKFETASLFYYLLIILYTILVILIAKAPNTKRKAKYGLF